MKINAQIFRCPLPLTRLFRNHHDDLKLRIHLRLSVLLLIALFSCVSHLILLINHLYSIYFFTTPLGVKIASGLEEKKRVEGLYKLNSLCIGQLLQADVVKEVKNPKVYWLLQFP